MFVIQSPHFTGAQRYELFLRTQCNSRKNKRKGFKNITLSSRSPRSGATPPGRPRPPDPAHNAPPARTPRPGPSMPDRPDRKTIPAARLPRVVQPAETTRSESSAAGNGRSSELPLRVPQQDKADPRRMEYHRHAETHGHRPHDAPRRIAPYAGCPTGAFQDRSPKRPLQCGMLAALHFGRRNRTVAFDDESDDHCFGPGRTGDLGRILQMLHRPFAEASGIAAPKGRHDFIGIYGPCADCALRPDRFFVRTFGAGYKTAAESSAPISVRRIFIGAWNLSKITFPCTTAKSPRILRHRRIKRSTGTRKALGTIASGRASSASFRRSGERRAVRQSELRQFRSERADPAALQRTVRSGYAAMNGQN